MDLPSCPLRLRLVLADMTQDREQRRYVWTIRRPLPVVLSSITGPDRGAILAWEQAVTDLG